jgi:hypothetical protein
LTVLVEETLMGDPTARQLTFELPEGMLPDGTFLRIAGSPVPAIGETYLMFVKNGEWRISPFTAFEQGLLRRVQISGKRYFVAKSGKPITAVSNDGFLFGEPIVAPITSIDIFGTNAQVSGAETVALPLKPEFLAARTAVAITADEVKSRVRDLIVARGLADRSGTVHLAPSGHSLEHQQGPGGGR